jgi:hypothetical protein
VTESLEEFCPLLRAREGGSPIALVSEYSANDRYTLSGPSSKRSFPSSIRTRSGRSGVYGYDDLYEALSGTDYLILRCPPMETTRGLIGREGLDTLPTDAIVINVAQGLT